MLTSTVESPKPIPNKRNTLGIFQYPWGEKSDQPVWQPPIPPPPTVAMFSETSLSNMVDAWHTPIVSSRASRTSQLSPTQRVEPPTYLQSFFEDYEDGHDSDSVNDMDGSSDECESDVDSIDVNGSRASTDEFDDSTLWNIASLLQTEPRDLPTRESMFFKEEIVEAFDQCDADDFNNPPLLDKRMIRFMPIQPLATGRSKSPTTPPRSSLLWQLTSDVVEKATLGIPQPHLEVWRAYQPRVPSARRLHQVSNQTAALESQTLWQTPLSSIVKDTDGGLWTTTKTPDVRNVVSSASIPAQAPLTGVTNAEIKLACTANVEGNEKDSSMVTTADVSPWPFSPCTSAAVVMEVQGAVKCSQSTSDILNTTDTSAESPALCEDFAPTDDDNTAVASLGVLASQYLWSRPEKQGSYSRIEQSNMLWCRSPARAFEPEGSFNISSRQQSLRSAKSSRQGGIAILETTALFTRELAPAKSPTNWLHLTSSDTHNVSQPEKELASDPETWKSAMEEKIGDPSGNGVAVPAPQSGSCVSPRSRADSAWSSGGQPDAKDASSNESPHL